VSRRVHIVHGSRSSRDASSGTPATINTTTVVAYRFCRPDDIPLLVRAVNRCFDVHFAEQPRLTVDEFRREMREVHLWPSNCMVATAGEEPVAVVLGTKEPHEVRVRRIGVAPGHQRHGHGRHLLESLGKKLAVLGPPRLVADVPVELSDAVAFFEALGWREDGHIRGASQALRFVTEAQAA
jgi:ribosomal protein S18 acetylase RimI-like enzyme